MRDKWTLGAVATVFAIAAFGCGAGDKKTEKPADSATQKAAGACAGGTQMACKCDDGSTQMACVIGHRAPVCPCFGNSDPAHLNSSIVMPGTGGATGTAGASEMAGSGGVMVAGSGGAPAMTGSGGMMVAGSGGGGPAMTGSGGGGMPTGTVEIEALRQVCVDTINMYRATVMVTPALTPLARGTADEETCSDKGAKFDGDAMQAHGSAGMCMGYGGQDTCPGWPVGAGGRGAYATVEAALLACLQQMWAEGEPPGGRAACTGDCFQTYGHYLNMSSPDYTALVCGFYLMDDGMSWWLNQDFKSKPWGGGP